MNATSLFRTPKAILAVLVVLNLALHFGTNHRYGYHGDELYFIACGERLDWGYVDHSPMIAVITQAERMFLGDSLRAIRFLPAVTTAAMLWLTGLMVLQMGGGAYAVGLAGLSFLVSPLFLRSSNMLTIVVFDQLWWVLACYLLILWIKTGNPKWWIVLGVVLGLGLMTKHSMLFFGFGLTIGLLATPYRKTFLTRWPWLAAAIAFLIFSPNLVWQIRHGWPTLEFLGNINQSRMAAISVPEFMIGQVLYLHPFIFPVWLAGLVWFFRAESARPYRIFGWVFLAIFILLASVKSKIYYLGPIYPVLIAGGGIAFERFTSRGKRTWMRPALMVFITLGGIAMAPLALPIFSLEGFDKFARVFERIVPNAHEGGGDIRSMLGHHEKVAAVAAGYDSLTAEEKEDCALWGGNYSLAGAVDFFGSELGLPKAISSHNNYWLWGPREYSLEKILTLGLDEAECRQAYSEVREAARFRVEYRPGSFYEDSVFFCQGLKIPKGELWRLAKSFD